MRTHQRPSVVAVAACLLILGMLASTCARAASNYRLTNAAIAQGEFLPPVWYYEDPTQQATLDQVRALYTQNQFHRASADFNGGISRPQHWFRVVVDVADDFDTGRYPQLYLEMLDPIINTIDLYHFRDGQLVEQMTLGSLLPFVQRPYPAPTFVVPIAVHAGQQHEFWMRVVTAHSMHLPLRVTTSERLMADSISTTYFYGLLLGLTIIMAFYNGLMGWRVRNISYLYYVGVLVAGTIHRMHASGLGMQFGWGDWPQLNPYVRPLMDNALAFFSLLFTQQFLNTRTFAPLLHRCLNALVIWSGLAGLAVFVLPEKIALYIALWTLLIAFLVQYAVGIDCWLNKMRHAQLFLLGWFVFLGGGVILVFATLGALPLNSITIHAAEVGLAIQVLALSFALSDRINTMEQEKAEAQQKTVESMTRFRELYEKSLDGLFEMTCEGEVLHANPAFGQLLDLPGAGVEFWPLFASARDRDVAQRKVAAGEPVVGLQCQLHTPGGKQIWASLSLVPSEKDGQKRLDGVLRDISESKAKDDALRAQKEAEAATTAKSAFLANMSHEIRTPLTAIIGFAEDARDPHYTYREREQCIDTVIRSSYHLLDVINDVLDLSKIEAGKLELEQINVDLLDLLADIQSVFGKRISDKGLIFTLDARLPLPRQFVSDPTRLKQIILNLLGNALKFTERGSVTLQVEYAPASDQLQISVIDTGIGISREQQGKIFEAFTQAEVSTARNYGGTGLGLNIVSQLLALMGGSVVVQSEPDQGSTFTVTIPARVRPGTQMITSLDKIAARQKLLESNQIPRLEGLVLYAEDNPVNQMLVRSLVQRTGARIETVKNGAEAMQFALRERPLLILMDISMPVISGATATRLLRSHGYRGAIVACTANVMANEVDQYIASGFDACLEKPIRRERFYAVLARYLASQASAAGE